LTQAGQVLGTPAYMSPEQARAEIDALDERADVFGLGAILCVILTGQPPYRGQDPSAIFLRAKEADLTDARERLAACDADADVVALCGECWQADPPARPAHAGVLAGRVSAYLASMQGRLQQAQVQHAAAEVKAQEERKRRRLAVSLAAAVVILLAGAGAV